MLLIVVVYGKLLNENSLDFNKNISFLEAGLPVSEWFCLFAQWPVSLILYIKKGTALTIPYSGEPERPRRSNYPFNVASSAKKHLLASVKVQSSYPCLHILYTFF